jgi:hypothetical protein
MCKSKSNGGLGFRDFECFNQAFLAKQGWHLLVDPDSLCAQVLKARYHKNSSFLDADCPKRASFTWRSIVYGRDLLEAGLIWRVGDGSKIKVWEDNWIPRSSAQQPLGWLMEEPPDRVCDFMLPDGQGWDEDKLRQFLSEPDVSDILRIPTGWLGSQDVPAWNFTKSGIFSVKSAYHLAVERKKLKKGNAESSNSSDDHRGRLALWDVQVPGKVKIHMWRLVENGLAVGTELSRRSIKDGVICLVCGRTENLVHRFWTCPHSVSAWAFLADLTGFHAPTPPKRLKCHSELKGWLLDWIGKAPADKLLWFFMLIYKLWLARNDARETKQIEDPRAIVEKAKAAVEEWSAVHVKTPSSNIRSVEHWLSPEPGRVKVNADGAFRTADSSGGSGVVL